MFGFLKNLLGGKSATTSAASSGVDARQTSPPAGPEAYGYETSHNVGSSPRHHGYSSTNGQAPAGAGYGSSGAPVNGTGGPQAQALRGTFGRGVELPLQPILDNLPLELRSKVRQQDVGSQTVQVPLDRILAQLAQGAVKISFAELRASVPQIFTATHEADKTPVTLPLREVLARINPALLKRRRLQKTIHVPDEITSPFDARSRTLQPPAVDTSRRTAPAAVPSAPAADAVARTPAPVSPEVPEPRAGLQATSPPPVPSPIPMPSSPVLPQSRLITPIQPDPDTALPVAGNGVNGRSGQHSAPGVNGSSAEVPSANGVAAPSGATLTVPLAPLTEAWPESLRRELLQLGVVEASIALPLDQVERGLRQGKVAFTWRTLRGWIRPSPAPSVSPHDATALDLPLKILAPLFLSKQRENAKSQTKVAVDESIPNLFFGFPQPDSAPGGAAATAKPADTNYYVWDDTHEKVRPVRPGEQPVPSAGTRFVTKYATPNEIVSRAGGLDGVAGALIALPDGLLVASQIPGDFNPDTLAAFLPQIFGKVTQCTKELRMGELNNLSFTVGNVPWKIFRVNAIYFAAFGRAGEPMPSAQLAALAAELDHKPK